MKAGEGVTVGGQTYQDRPDACEAMNALLKRCLNRPASETSRVPVGSYRGMSLTLEIRKDRFPEMIVSGANTHFLEFRAVAAGTLLNRIDNMIEALPLDAERARDQSHMKARQLESYTGRIGRMFDQEARFERVQEMRHELETLLSDDQVENRQDRITALVDEFQSLKEQTAPPPAPAVLEPLILPEPVIALAVDHEPEATAPEQDEAPPLTLAVSHPHAAEPKSLLDALEVPEQKAKPQSWVGREKKRWASNGVQLSLF